MKKILIVSYHFAPYNSIGSIRPTKLASYLTKFGYEVTVIRGEINNVESQEMKKDLKHLNKVVVIKHSRFYKLFLKCLKHLSDRKKNFYSPDINKKHSTNEIKKINIKTRIKRNLAGIRPLIRDYDFYKKTFREINKSKVDVSSYDVVFSTYNIMGNHLIAKKIKKLNPNIKWIADFRDPVITPEKKGTIKSIIYENITKEVLEKCNHIVAVSEGYLKMLIGDNYSYKSHVIYNGYDPQENNEFKKTQSMNNKLTFVYTGVIYGGKRDLSPIFKAVSILIQKEKVDIDKVQFIYAGKERKYFESIADNYNLLNSIVAYDFLPRKEALKIQFNSDLLVVATWNYADYYGVIPGKFIEYMNANKKIIGLVEGDQQGSEIKRIIDDNELGICFERVTEKNDFNSLCDFIENEYNNKFEPKRRGLIKSTSPVEKFSYDNITQQIMGLINS